MFEVLWIDGKMSAASSDCSNTHNNVSNTRRIKSRGPIPGRCTPFRVFGIALVNHPSPPFPSRLSAELQHQFPESPSLL